MKYQKYYIYCGVSRSSRVDVPDLSKMNLTMKLLRFTLTRKEKNP